MIFESIPDGAHVGVVGSSSTTGTLVVDLVGDARSASLAGKTVLVAPTTDKGSREYGLGVVTQITTTNIHHENPALRGVIAAQGTLGGLTGAADIKTAVIDLTSAFADSGGGALRASGAALTFAPSTGERVYVVDAATITSLASATASDLFYMGSMYRQSDIPLPLSVHDFSGPRGSEFAAFMGPSGMGKTYVATYFVGAQLRHRSMAFLLIDPQGQFVTNSKIGRELPFDLRELASTQGRTVRQLSVARDVRLPEDPRLFVDLLDGAAFFGASRLVGARTNAGEAREVVLAWLETQPGWSEQDPDAFLTDLLTYLVEQVEAGAVAVSKAPKERMTEALQAALDQSTPAGQTRRREMLRVLTPFLALFADASDDGRSRVPLREIVADLIRSDTGYAGARVARPFYILTLADTRRGSAADDEVSKALQRTKTQMVVLRTLFSALEEEGRHVYQDDDAAPANLMVIMDEAARFTSDSNRDPEQRAMANDMARFFRELRKYAIGFTLILQEPSALHDSIWKQLRNGFRAFAGGLVGNDLERVREQVGNPNALRLYQQLAMPTKDNPIYPWMLCGNISPINVTSNPTFMEAFTSAHQWAAANASWIPGTFDVTNVWARPRG